MKRASTLFAVLCSAAMLSCSLLPGPMAPNCKDERIRDYPSPDGKRKVIEYHSTCDEGPQPHHTMIEVADADGKNRASAMFATPHDQQKVVWPELKIEWRSPAELWVTYPAATDAQCISSPAGVAVHCLDGSIAR